MECSLKAAEKDSLFDCARGDEVEDHDFFALLPEAVDPPNALLGGSTAQSNIATQGCYVGHGFSTFQRNSNSARAEISFSELVDSGGYDLKGQAVLSFTPPGLNSGTIIFTEVPSYPASVRMPSFSSYSQTYANGRLQVVFLISFPDCTLNVNAVYNN